ncbi:MAG: exosortase [Proteobacteria bacterium]|nr:exosortase [Pseudomonadota bacterium]
MTTRNPRNGKLPEFVPILPAWLWVLLPVVALWPIWLWTVERFCDGSDDPLGVLAIALLLISVWRERQSFVSRPRTGGIAVAVLLAAAASFSGLPSLARAVIAVLAVMAVLFALRGARTPLLAWVGLGLLALPVLSSLQFFAGYPLRIVTAEASAQLLQLIGLSVVRQGGALMVQGKLIVVDAPCSGIQMAWMGYFTACGTAAWLRLSNKAFLCRLPLIGLIVMSGNILRNTLLVAKESGLVAWPAWSHEAVGLAAFALVCLLILRHVAAATAKTWVAPLYSFSPSGKRTLLAAACSFAVIGLMQALVPENASAHSTENRQEWPNEFEGRPLQPMALSSVEQRFAENFPGAIARFNNQNQIVTLRDVRQPTRKLHPARDCYRGLGYGISEESLQESKTGLQRCFIARRGGNALQVCEYIQDKAGHSFTDASSWYWAAVIGDSHGPWRAVTTARSL